MGKDSAPEAVHQAIKAVQAKKAFDLALLDLRAVASFTDYFLLCTGASARQNQAIADGVEEQLNRMGLAPLHVEGYEFGEWVLVDYLDFVVHIFSEHARAHYNLERLWRGARRLPLPQSDETRRQKLK